MEEALSRDRGATALRGLLAIGLGVAALAWPHLTVAILVVGFAAYAIADGFFTLVTAASSADRERAWLTAIEGVLSIAAGAFVLFAPATATRLAFVGIGLWALFTGAMQLFEAPRLHDEVANERVLAVSGIVRFLLGVMLLLRPHAGLNALVLLLALYAFMEGILMLGLAVAGKPRGPVKAQHA
jgi:uncharacterized membrane protein HdeD (DUF308 family)